MIVTELGGKARHTLGKIGEGIGEFVHTQLNHEQLRRETVNRMPHIAGREAVRRAIQSRRPQA